MSGRYEQALVAYQQGQFDHCLGLLQAIASEGPVGPEVLHLMAACLLHKQQWNHAADLYRRLVEFDPDDLEANYGLGLACMVGGDRRLAETCFRKVATVDPSHQRAWNQLGTLYCLEANWPRAADCLARSLEFFPEDVESLTNLGIAYAQMGQTERARKAWQAALAINPAAEAARRNLAHLDAQ